MKEVQLLVDLDPCVYACGFAGQSSSYSVVYEDEQSRMQSKIFSATQDETAGALMKRWEQETGNAIIDKEKLVIPDPLDHVLHIVRRHLTAISEAGDRHSLAQRRQRPSFNGFLSGRTNYRNELAVSAPYKGNRDKASRPYHFANIREFLIDVYHPRISENCEADDLISIIAEQNRTQHIDSIVVSIDKDLDQIEGWHYNPDKKVFYIQDRDSAKLYFFQQCLSGDSTDNIPGCPGIGAGKAEKLIKEWTAGIEEHVTIQAEYRIWDSIVDTYRAKGSTALHALETARLVYIQKAPNELWAPPGEAFGTIS